MAHLDTVTTPHATAPDAPPHEPSATPPSAPAEGSPEWYALPFETREIRKARERAARASRRADRAARRVHEAQERAAQRTGARQFLDVAGDAATAALTAVSAAADEAQARLAAKARMRQLEHAVVTARAGGRVDIAPPTRTEALRLADRVDPGSTASSVARGVGLMVAGIVALLMAVIGGFGWLGAGVPVVILITGGWVGNRIELEDRSRKAALIQAQLARASLPAPASASVPALPTGSSVGRSTEGGRSTATVPGQTGVTGSGRRRIALLEGGDPRVRSEILARLDRLIANVQGLLEEHDLATLQRIRTSAALALPPDDAPLDLSDHETWLLRQICIDYLPGALEHYLALPSDLASERVLDGRSAREILDEQLVLIQRRLGTMATRTYKREAGDLLTHARFVADALRPDPFQARLAELAAQATGPELLASPESLAAPGPRVAQVEPGAREPAHASSTSATADPAASARERA
jgi:hypothetical protein